MKSMELDPNKEYALDTNILVAFAERPKDFVLGIENLFKNFKKLKKKPYIPDKCLYEYFAVASSLKKLGRGEADAKTTIDYFIDSASTIVISQTDYTHYLVRDLLERKEVSGKYIHDVVLIAILLENNIDCIITQNKKDFEGILGLEVLSLDDFQ